MPYGARTSLAALILSLALGVTGACAEQASGTTWTDPPARKPAPATNPAETQKAAPPAASTQAAASQASAPVAARKAVAAHHVPKRMAARRAAPPPKRVATRPMPIAASPGRIARPSRMVAVAPPPPPVGGYARYRTYGYGPGYGPDYADERLERLRAAEAAGYLVVRGRTVEYPDGRSLRVYRPDDGGEPF